MLYKLMLYLKNKKMASEQQRMTDFLSQAQSREHLEYLEREWFRQHRGL